MRRLLALLIILVSLALTVSAADDPVVVIGHPGVPKADLATIQRLYAGRVVSIGEIAAFPVNLAKGNVVRLQFLSSLLGQTEEQYTGYWLVRRYVGKGAPPQELADLAEMLRFVASNPGAVGYVPLSAVPAGTNVIFKRQ